MKQTFYLKGQVPAQKNTKQVAYNRRTGRPFIMTSKSTKDWQLMAANQLRVLNIKPFEGEVSIECVFFHKDKRKRDIDNELASIMDLLKNNGIIEDDNCFVVREIKLSFGGIDKDNPGAKIAINNLDRQ